ncbi:hypothetical protein HYE67_005146 [Fusarium culmorum]|uniref:Uncharacterized protein n=1 Tax=Fusarium culmorum TaxID=5516 RepID=A0A2T4GG09_FUSCU|nr:hypothetical protein FCULG_00012861 [Fusarium culmorum]PTD02588.1 hypothetical protein FCULG_00012598 [Fusarium culmorum]QPC62915.1 hypothetical protein HYE67_005146 [Fusarium culmorum]
MYHEHGIELGEGSLIPTCTMCKAWLTSLSLGITILGLCQINTLSGIACVAAVVLTSAAIVTIVTAASTAMHQVTILQPVGRLERVNLVIGWSPLFLLGVVIQELAIGMLLWHTGNCSNEWVMFLASDLAVLVTVIMVSLWVRRQIGELIGLARLSKKEGSSANFYYPLLE